MDETEVVENLATHLDDLDYTFFVDSGYGRSTVERLADSLDNCNVNRTITIGRRIPDVIGITPQQEIFAIEAKGSSGVRKGIGQAAYYRQGVHKSYVAATDKSLAEFRDTILSCGLGLFSVTSSTIDSKSPVTNIGATNIDRTRRALAVKTSRFQSAGNSFPPMTRPENALLPVVAIASVDSSEWSIPESECERVIRESDQTYNQASSAISLAKTLQLVRSIGDDLKLTDTGVACYYLLRGIVEHRSAASDSAAIFDFIDHVKHQRRALLSDVSPELAAFLRDRYLSVPDIRLLVYVLSAYDGSRAELSRILAEISLASPDAFLNLFCGQGEESEFRDLVDGSQFDSDDPDYRESILELVSPNAMYNFVYQIRHIGLLTDESQPVHQGDSLEMDQFYWAWDTDVVGELGVGEI